MQVLVTEDPAVAKAWAVPLIEEDPCGAAVAASLCTDAIRRGEPGWFAVAMQRDTPVLLAAQAPTSGVVVLTSGRPAAIHAVADVLVAAQPQLVGVHADAQVAAQVAGRYAAGTNRGAVPVRAQRRYSLLEVIAPLDNGGYSRLAEPSERAELHRVARSANPLPEAIALDDAALDGLLVAERVFVHEFEGTLRAAAVALAAEESAVPVVVLADDAARLSGAVGCVVAACSAVVLAQGLTPMVTAELSTPGADTVLQRLGFSVDAESLTYRFV